MGETRQALGQVIRIMRSVRGLKQLELAERAGYNRQSSLSKLELGRRTPTFEEVDRLLAALGYDLCDLDRGLRSLERGDEEAWRRELASRRPGDDTAILHRILDHPDFRHLSAADRQLFGWVIAGELAKSRLLARLSPDAADDDAPADAAGDAAPPADPPPEPSDDGD